MKILLFFSLIENFLWCLTQGSPFPAKSIGGIEFFVDGASFLSGDGGMRQEIYYAIPGTSLVFEKNMRGEWGAFFKTMITVKDTSGKRLGGDEWRSEKWIASLEDVKRRQLTISNQFSFVVKPGKYKVEIVVSDSISGRKGICEVEIIISPVVMNKIALSEIELASFVQPDTSNSNFTKNGFKVIPNPTRRFGGRLGLLYLYCEIYNFKINKNDKKGKYSVEYSFLDSSGNVLKTLPPKMAEKPGGSVVEVGGLNVMALKPGNYNLRLKVRDEETGEEAIGSANFFMEGIEIVKREGAKEEYFLEIPDADKYYSKIEYIATRETLKLYQSLSEQGKRNFLRDFWNRHDLRSFVENFKYVEEHFSSGFRKGYETDMGRIYLKYGKPDEIEDHPADSQFKAHQNWFYYGKGGKQFIFQDVSGYGRFELIYSSIKEEISNPNWPTMIDIKEIRK